MKRHKTLISFPATDIMIPAGSEMLPTRTTEGISAYSPLVYSKTTVKGRVYEVFNLMGYIKYDKEFIENNKEYFREMNEQEVRESAQKQNKLRNAYTKAMEQKVIVPKIHVK